MICPFLFVMHINDLSTVVKYSTLDLYDDAEMSHSDLSVVEKCLQSDLDDVTRWPGLAVLSYV